MQTHLISAICTPLADDDSLHVDGLAAHLDDQWRHGISGVLIAGSMGLMQLLDDATYRNLVRHGVQFSAGRGEILVGAATPVSNAPCSASSTSSSSTSTASSCSRPTSTPSDKPI